MSLSYVANAPIGPLEVELSYDVTPGMTSGRIGRSSSESQGLTEWVGAFCGRTESFDASMPTSARGVKRVQRALFQYALALRFWQIGTEFQSLSHLWIAAENVAHRFLDARRAGRSKEALAASSAWT